MSWKKIKEEIGSLCYLARSAAVTGCAVALGIIVTYFMLKLGEWIGSFLT